MIDVKYLKENFLGKHTMAPLSSGLGLDDGSYNLHDLQDQKIMDMIDGYIGSIAERTYINPYSALRNLNNKLSVMGLRFDDDQPIRAGTQYYHLTQFGGRYGRLDHTSFDVGSDDGIVQKFGHSLAIEMNFSQDATNRWRILAKVVPMPDSTSVRKPGISYTTTDQQEFALEEEYSDVDLVDAVPANEKCSMKAYDEKEKLVETISDISKDEIKHALRILRKRYPSARIDVMDKSGKTLKRVDKRHGSEAEKNYLKSE